MAIVDMNASAHKIFTHRIEQEGITVVRDSECRLDNVRPPGESENQSVTGGRPFVQRAADD